MARLTRDERRARIAEDWKQHWLSILRQMAERGRRNQMKTQPTKVRGPGENDYWQQCADGKWWYFVDDQKLRIATIWESHIIESFNLDQCIDRSIVQHCPECVKKQRFFYHYMGQQDVAWYRCSECGVMSKDYTGAPPPHWPIPHEPAQVDEIRQFVKEEEIEHLVDERRSRTSVAKWCGYCRTLLDYIDGISTKTITIPRGFYTDRSIPRRMEELRKKHDELDVADQLARKAVEIASVANVSAEVALKILRQCLDIAQENGLRGLVP